MFDSLGFRRLGFVSFLGVGVSFVSSGLLTLAVVVFARRFAVVFIAGCLYCVCFGCWGVICAGWV